MFLFLLELVVSQYGQGLESLTEAKDRGALQGSAVHRMIQKVQVPMQVGPAPFTPGL